MKGISDMSNRWLKKFSSLAENKKEKLAFGVDEKLFNLVRNWEKKPINCLIKNFLT